MVVQCIVKIITKWNRKSDGYMVYIQYMIRIVYEHNIIVNVRVFLIQKNISNSLVAVQNRTFLKTQNIYTIVDHQYKT